MPVSPNYMPMSLWHYLVGPLADTTLICLIVCGHKPPSQQIEYDKLIADQCQHAQMAFFHMSPTDVNCHFIPNQPVLQIVPLVPQMY